MVACESTLFAVFQRVRQMCQVPHCRIGSPGPFVGASAPEEDHAGSPIVAHGHPIVAAFARAPAEASPPHRQRM